MWCVPAVLGTVEAGSSTVKPPPLLSCIQSNLGTISFIARSAQYPLSVHPACSAALCLGASCVRRDSRRTQIVMTVGVKKAHHGHSANGE